MRVRLLSQTARSVSFLTAADPDPVGLVNAESSIPVVLLCEHAGRAVPETLGDLGLPTGVLDSHRGWDIGAEAVALQVADRLAAPLIAQRYSRLVVDCNRPPESTDFVPETSDGIAIPSNGGLSLAERMDRRAAIFDPMNAALDTLFAQASRCAAFSIHSFTPEMHGKPRPWHAGFLSRTDLETAQRLKGHIETANPELTLALNEPYKIDGRSDWFIPAHAESRGLAHTLIEIRNDQLQSPEGIARWAALLSDAITHVVEQLKCS